VAGYRTDPVCFLWSEACKVLAQFSNPSCRACLSADRRELRIPPLPLKFALHGDGQQAGGGGTRDAAAVIVDKILTYSIYMVRIGMVPVVLQLILHEQKDHQAAGHASSEAKGVDEREAFILPELAERNFQVVFEYRNRGLFNFTLFLHRSNSYCLNTSSFLDCKFKRSFFLIYFKWMYMSQI